MAKAKANSKKAVAVMDRDTAINGVVDTGVALHEAKGHADNSLKQYMAGYFIPTYGERAMAEYKATKCKSEDSLKAHASDLGISVSLLQSLIADQAEIYKLAEEKKISGSALWQSLKRAYYGRKPAVRKPEAGGDKPQGGEGGEGDALTTAQAAAQSPTMAAITLGQFVIGLNELIEATGKAGLDTGKLVEARELCAKAVTLLRKAGE